MRVSLFFAAAMVSTGCNQRVEKPKPPDMSHLVRAYESPAGVLDEETMAEVLGDIDAKLQVLEDLGLNTEVQEVVRELEELASSSASEPESESQGTVEVDDKSFTIEGGGFGVVTRICDGWGPEPIPDHVTNGNLELTATFTDITLDPVIWLDANRCRYTTDDSLDSRVLVESGRDAAVGDIRLWVGEGIELADASDIEDGPFIMDLDLTVTLHALEEPGEPARVDYDWRLSDQQDVELRVETSTGDLIAVTNDRTLLAVRAANGYFVCDDDSCTREDGLDVPYPQ